MVAICDKNICGEMKQIVEANKNGTRGDDVKAKTQRKKGYPKQRAKHQRTRHHCLAFTQEDIASGYDLRAAQIRSISRWLAEVIRFALSHRTTVEGNKLSAILWSLRFRC